MTHQSAKGWQDHALFQCFKSAIRLKSAIGRKTGFALRSQNGSAGGVEQARDGAVNLVILAFAVMMENDLATLIDDVL